MPTLLYCWVPTLLYWWVPTLLCGSPLNCPSLQPTADHRLCFLSICLQQWLAILLPEPAILCHGQQYSCHGQQYSCHAQQYSFHGQQYSFHGHQYSCHGHQYSCHDQQYSCHGQQYFCRRPSKCLQHSCHGKPYFCCGTYWYNFKVLYILRCGPMVQCHLVTGTCLHLTSSLRTRANPHYTVNFSVWLCTFTLWRAVW